MNKSLTSLIYDQCALDQREALSNSQFNLIVDPSIVESKQKCFQAHSPFTGNPYNSIPSEFVDVESELSGLNKLNSKCNAKKYHRDNSASKKLYLDRCQGQNDLKIQYTRMKKSHNQTENDLENERISKNNFYPQTSSDNENNFEKSRMENNQRIHGEYLYTKFDQNTRENLKKFIQEKRNNSKWLYQ